MTGIAPRRGEIPRWEVLTRISDETDVVSYLLDARTREEAERQVAKLPEVERVYEVIRVERRADR
jgi:hypothetical protein